MLCLFFIGLVSCGKILNEPLEEYNPSLRDTISQQDTTGNQSGKSSTVRRVSILESFGSLNCSSCPEAEKKFVPYIHPELDTREVFNSNLVIVNYHVSFFSNDDDEWITTLSQNIYDKYSFISLPQVKLNGSNGNYGFTEKFVKYQEYDNMLAALANDEDSLTFLKLAIDTTTLIIDSTQHTISFRFKVSNLHDSIPDSSLAFRVLIVKNYPVVFTGAIESPWEVIVVGGTETDKSGADLISAVIPPQLTQSFHVFITDLDEKNKHQGRGGVTPGFPVGKVETVYEYAILILAIDGITGIIKNVISYNYDPEEYKP